VRHPPNPLTGRFETMDPAEGNILNPATLHKYVYAASNPVNRIDPTGQADLLEVVGKLWASDITQTIVFVARMVCYIEGASLGVAELTTLTFHGLFLACPA
jgi:hypothetical protein